MLLQKREENAITLAATANNAKIIDEPVTDGGPVSPKPKNDLYDCSGAGSRAACGYHFP